MWASLALLLFCFSTSFSSLDQPEFTFEEFYQDGKNAYTNHKWADCINFMRRALEDFRYFEDELVACRKICYSQIETPGIETISQYYAESERALCLLRCRRDRFSELRPDMKKMTAYFDFMERKPYEYMHICYWKSNELELAVQSAYTFLVKNPGHKVATEALNFYMNQENYHDDMLVDALRLPYETHFIEGVSGYETEDWGKCIGELETSLQKFLIEEENCRAICQDKIDWTLVDGNPEVDVLLTSIRSSILKCQHNCLFRLSVVNGHDLGNFVSSVYEYLHYCQYKSMLGSDAAKSVTTYLLFDNNPLMRRNHYFYEKEFKTSDIFVPDSVIANFYKKRVLEKRYLNFIEEKFKYVNNEFPPERLDDRKKMDLEVNLEDNFEYTSIPNLIKEGECQILRSIFQNALAPALIEELEQRIRHFWPTARYESAVCQRQARHAACPKALVLSTEPSDCSEWLGAVHAGCAIVFCT